MKLNSTGPIFFLLALSAMSAVSQQSTTTTPEASQPSTPVQALPDAPTSNAPVVVQPTGPTAVLDTSMGRISCRLFQKEAPETVANFIELAEGKKDWTDPATHKKMHNKPLYNGTVFHRVIPDFMIQGGDPTATGMGDPGYMFKDEFDENLNFDVAGRLAMANSGPNTNGSQFFITEGATEHLNQRHTIFGQCDDAGVTVVKSIARVDRDGNDKPTTDVVLTKVTIVPEGKALPPVPPLHPHPARRSPTSKEAGENRCRLHQELMPSSQPVRARLPRNSSPITRPRR